MRVRFILTMCAFSAAAQASTSYRVGNELLTAGDGAARVIELLGKPTYKSSHNSSLGNATHGGSRSSRRPPAGTPYTPGEQQWQYRRDGRVVTVTIVDGVVKGIEDRRD
jgi:hypothetical protein